MPKAKPAPATFGGRLTQLRQSRGLSVSGLAAAAGTSRQYVRDLERGAKTEPGWSLVGRLADALGCSLDDLRGRTKEAE